MNEIEFLILDRSYHGRIGFPVHCFLDPINHCNSRLKTDEDSVARAFTSLRTQGAVVIYDAMFEGLQELDPDFEIRDALPDRKRLVFQVMDRGFELWESESKPNWSKVIIGSLIPEQFKAKYAGVKEKTHTVRGLDRSFLEEYLSRLVDEGLLIEESSLEWKQLGSWKPYPFKELPTGWSVTFHCIFPLDKGYFLSHPLLEFENAWRGKSHS